jgi:hypothetical protein
MSGIQLLLLTAVLFVGVYAVVRLRNRIADVLLLLALVAVAAVFILAPDYTTLLAQKLGVGRGADLVLYTWVVLVWFVLLKLYTKLRKLEQTITELLRNEALKNADAPNNTDGSE